jgi:hypothetical protein
MPGELPLPVVLCIGSGDLKMERTDRLFVDFRQIDSFSQIFCEFYQRVARQISGEVGHLPKIRVSLRSFIPKGDGFQTLGKRRTLDLTRELPWPVIHNCPHAAVEYY